MEKVTITKVGNTTTIHVHDIELGKKVKKFFDEIYDKKRAWHKELQEKWKANQQGAEPTC